MKLNIKKWINKLGIDWKKWVVIIALGIMVPITSLFLRIVNTSVSDADITSVYYIYLTDNNVLLWIIIYLLLTVYYKGNGSKSKAVVGEPIMETWDNKYDDIWDSTEEPSEPIFQKVTKNDYKLFNEMKKKDYGNYKSFECPDEEGYND